MESSPFGGVGRPTLDESKARRDEFLRLIAAGVPFDEAADRARINARRALRLLWTIRPMLEAA